MQLTPDKTYMRLAIKEARKNLLTLHGGPFGACIIKNDRVISVARNTVLKHDATCHAEVNAIRIASRKLKTCDLSGCVIYSTTEPCPMCFSAIHWARVSAIVYGSSIYDAAKLKFNELKISNIKMKALGKSAVRVYGRFCGIECGKLLKEWSSLDKKRAY
jgi:guanine deaminase